MRLREILQQIIEDRTKSMRGILAKHAGLKRKPGFGNYGIGDFITHRSIKGQLKPVVPHIIGLKPTMTGEPDILLTQKKKPW